MNSKNICVVGAGQMGQQIALNAAIHGFKVNLFDSYEHAMRKAKKWVNDYLQGRIQKGKMTEEKVMEVKRNINFTKKIEEAVADADFVIEAIIEKLDAKRELFSELDKVCPTKTILATNSSSFCPSQLATATNRVDKVIGMHFFNPALVMDLVEVIKGPETSGDTIDAVEQLSKDFGKDPIILMKEINGFVVNRILGRIFEEACRLIEAGIATPQEIDKAIEKGLRHPMGPCKIMDQSGMDTVYLIRVQRYAESQNEIDKPIGIMKEMYEKGQLGKKSGKGFYEYNEDGTIKN